MFTKPEEIANQFNKYFVNIGPDLEKHIPHNSQPPGFYLKERSTNSIFLKPVIEKEVLDVLTSLKNCSAGWDGISARAIKSAKALIVSPLVHICNLSFYNGVFPSQLKIAHVIPIFKGGLNYLFTNYRPISILPVFSKVLEKIMFNRISSFIEKMSIIYKYQFGFRNMYSSYMAMIVLKEKVSRALEKGENITGVFLDFSKAFDTVDHNILISKLDHYGIRGNALNWITSYLTQRKQYVQFDGAKSQYLNVKCGVPQGSILGPLLFVLYVNDMYMACKSSFPLLFADGSNIFF
jgi:hypothetical protein